MQKVKSSLELYPEESIVDLVRAACAQVIEKLVAVTKLQLRTLTAVYRFEVSEEKAWLLGVEECIMRRGKACGKEPTPLNVVSLHIEQRQQSRRSNTVLIVPRQEDWPERRSPPAFRLFSRPRLKSCLNRSLLGPSQRVLNSRLDRSILARSRAERRKMLREVQTNSGEEACCGLFCAWSGVQYSDFLPYNSRSRFKIPSELVEVAKKQEFSPVFNANLLVSPSKYPLSHHKSISAGQLPKAASTVSVCLRCYFVYKNVAKALQVTKEVRQRCRVNAAEV